MIPAPDRRAATAVAAILAFQPIGTVPTLFAAHQTSSCRSRASTRLSVRRAAPSRSPA